MSNQDENNQINPIFEDIKKDIIGYNLLFKSPFGIKRIIYADYTASGKSIYSIESYLKRKIHPFYANVHSESGFLSEQSENFRKEAKQIVRRHVNADERDSIIFYGQGSTGCINKLVRLLNLKEKVGLYNLMKIGKSQIEHRIGRGNFNEDEFIQDNSSLLFEIRRKYMEIYEIHNFLFANRWGTFDCLLCKMTFSIESQFLSHENDFHHQSNLKRMNLLGKGNIKTGIDNFSYKEIIRFLTSNEYKKFRPIVFLSIMEHNSNALPWRDTGAKVIYIHKNKETNELDYDSLKELTLKYKDNYMKIGAFTAASNITGELTNVDLLSIIMHEVNGLAFFDYATAAPYVKIDMNSIQKENFLNSNQENYFNKLSESQKKLCFKDGIYFSPHKFLGGTNTNGVLVVKQNVIRTLLKPADTGGGVVLFVTETSSDYVKNIEVREEAGTPDIISSARIALSILYKEKVSYEEKKKREMEISDIVNKRLSQINNIILIGGKRHKAQLPIYSFLISFNGKFLHYNYVSALLNDLFGIQSRGGCSCASTYGISSLEINEKTLSSLQQATLSGKEIFRPGYTRLNFSYLNNNYEVQYILDAIEFICLFGWMFLQQYSYKIESGVYFHVHKDKKQRQWISDFNSINNINSDTDNIESRACNDKTICSIGNENTNVIDLYDEEIFFSNEKRMKYLVSSIDCLYKINETTKKVIGKSNINYSIQFDQEKMNEMRWFLISDDIYDLYNRTINIFDNDINYKINSKENILLLQQGDPLYKVLNISDFEFLQHSFNKNKETPFGNLLKNELFNESSFKVIEKVKKDNETYKEIMECNVDADDFDFSITTNDKKKEKLNSYLFPLVPKSITSLVGEALIKFNMIQNGDRILIGLSGGKDSMTLIHTLLYFKKHAPVKFDIGVITVDPQSDDFKPEPLKDYVKSLGLPYFFESDPILERAKKAMKEKESICAFCSRMKRGIIYGCARREKYNVIALGQHLDDLAESFLMSCFHNGLLRTMKANYIIDAGDLRVIRPFIFCRERLFKEFAEKEKLPIIQENCPACFSAPKERHRMKILLSQQENLYPNLFSSLQKAMIPLMKGEIEGMEKKKDDIEI